MVNPVPSHPRITTPFGRRGSWWSCNRNSQGGIHTGADFGSPGINGARVVAARAGTVRHVNYGSAFGPNQVLIVAGDGSGDFYAHMSARRTRHGQRVKRGERIGTVGSMGNSSGPHLHFERHRNANAGWSCGNVVNPQPSINAGGGSGSNQKTVRLSRLRKGLENGDVKRLKRRLNKLNNAGLNGTGRYGGKTDEAVRRDQRRNGFTTANKPNGTNRVGPQQAERLWRGTSVRVIDDR